MTHKLLKSKTGRTTVGPTTARLIMFGVLGGIICTFYSAASEVDDHFSKMADERTERLYGSVDCSATIGELTRTFKDAIRSGDKENMINAVNQIKAYEDGLGAKAFGDHCVFKQLREDIAIFQLD